MDKPTAAALDAFQQAVPDDPRAEGRKMFGMPCAFVNGNMFCGVFADGVTLRLGADRRAELSGLDGVGPFEPMEGRPWKEYVFAEAARWGGTDELAGWAREALDHTATLPPKKKKARKKKA